MKFIEFHEKVIDNLKNDFGIEMEQIANPEDTLLIDDMSICEGHFYDLGYAIVSVIFNDSNISGVISYEIFIVLKNDENISYYEELLTDIDSIDSEISGTISLIDITNKIIKLINCQQAEYIKNPKDFI